MDGRLFVKSGKKATPILSFPGVQLIGHTVEEPAAGLLSPSLIDEFSSTYVQKVREAVELMERCCKYPNFVIASGCDIPPMTPMENLQAFFDAVNEFYQN